MASAYSALALLHSDETAHNRYDLSVLKRERYEVRTRNKARQYELNEHASYSEFFGTHSTTSTN
jgi:hypothetical protein